jgi:hypothetical protein
MCTVSVDGVRFMTEVTWRAARMKKVRSSPPVSTSVRFGNAAATLSSETAAAPFSV